MIRVTILYNAFSDRFSGYKVEGKSRAPRNEAVYCLAKATFAAIKDRFNSAKLAKDVESVYEVWDIRENKQAQAAAWVFQKGIEQLSEDYPSEVELKIVDKFDI